MKAVAAALLCLALTLGGAAEDAGRTASDPAFWCGFLAGDYRIVGQKPDSGAAYVGKLTLREKEHGLAVTRVIAGVTSNGTATIETSSEGLHVLRMRIVLDGVEHAGTYLWQTDLDNYPRLTGYVYRVKGGTSSPGLEALFHIPPTPAK